MSTWGVGRGLAALVFCALLPVSNVTEVIQGEFSNGPLWLNPGRGGGDPTS